jgi:hypothetical protein
LHACTGVPTSSFMTEEKKTNKKKYKKKTNKIYKKRTLEINIAMIKINPG